MKNMKQIVMLTFMVILSNSSLSQENVTIAYSCGETVGKCVGSSYCSACTNCSRCGHCSSGGSCGVCSRRKNYKSKENSKPKHNSSSEKKQSNSYTSKSKTNAYDLPNDITSKYYLKNLLVNITALNLRSGPGTSYSIIEVLKKEQNLTFLAMTGNWVKVKVNLTSTIGFVYYNHILVSTE